MAATEQLRRARFGRQVDQRDRYGDRIDAQPFTRFRRAKLYYLRGRRGKSARIAERRDTRPEKGSESSEA
jgi:large subunit ribosomal protein L19